LVYFFVFIIENAWSKKKQKSYILFIIKIGGILVLFIYI